MSYIEDAIERKLERERKTELATSINDELDRARPKGEQFVGVYGEDEIAKDNRKIKEYFDKRGVNREEERKQLKDGILIEKVFLDSELTDLFNEEESYDELMTDDDDFLLYTIPAHEYDDTFNNVDIICVVRNEFTNHETVVFAVDCTSNSSKVKEKAEYKRTDEKIAGFTELKYFDNTASFDGRDGSSAGRIPKVPRFVVGFDADLARDIVVNDDKNGWLKDELDQKKDMMRYYLLKELAHQSEQRDTGLERYFSFLLGRFMESHEDEIKNYPNDSVMKSVLELKEGGAE